MYLCQFFPEIMSYQGETTANRENRLNINLRKRVGHEVPAFCSSKRAVRIDKAVYMSLLTERKPTCGSAGAGASWERGYKHVAPNGAETNLRLRWSRRVLGAGL